MPLDFPNSPSVGATYSPAGVSKSWIYTGEQWSAITAPIEEGASVTVSDTPPSGASAGDLWFDSSSGVTSVYYDGTWVDVGGGDSGTSAGSVNGIVQCDGAGNFSAAGPFAFRNKIINGNFDIWQRGTSLSSGTGGRYLADRFTNGSAGTTCTAAQSAFALGQPDVPNEPEYYISTAVTSVAGASNNATLHQHIESVKSCAGKTVTLSFYAKSNASRNIAVELYQNFGTGGTPSTSVSIPAGLKALTTSWQKFTVTVGVPSISGKVLGTGGNDSLVVYFWFDAGSSNSSRASSLGQQSGTFDIAQVQLEEGSIATPFELRPIGTELSLCQRYYQTSGTTNAANLIRFHGNVTNGSSYSANVWLKVQMRADPTPTLQSQGTPVGFPPTVGTVGTGVLAIVETRTANATAPAVFSSWFTADAEL